MVGEAQGGSAGVGLRRQTRPKERWWSLGDLTGSDCALREKGRHRERWDVTGCDGDPGAPAAVGEGREAREVGDRGKWESGDRGQDGGMDTLAGRGPWAGQQRTSWGHTACGAAGMQGGAVVCRTS